MGGFVMNVVFEFFGGNTQLIYKDLFKRYLQGSALNYSFRGELWRFLLALSGPAYIVCPLQSSVKDSMVYCCE